MTLLDVPPGEILRGLDPSSVTEAPEGTVYLLHLDSPLVALGGTYRWGHYIGHAAQGRLVTRLEQHERSRGANFTRRAKMMGLTWHLARVWPGGYDRERQIKKQGGASRFCPSCGIITAAERQLLRDVSGRYVTPPGRT